MNTTVSPSRRGFLAAGATALGAIGGWTAARVTPERERELATPAPRAPFRRVVTGHNAAGKSVITHDGPVPLPAQDCCSEEQIARAPFLRGVSANELWLFDSVPADLSNTADPLTGPMPAGNTASRGGITARIVRYEPGVAYPMHTTATLDLAIVISGRLELQLEEGRTIVEPGEVVVQRGTRHSWRVVGNQPVVVVFVLVDAINGLVPRTA